MARRWTPRRFVRLRRIRVAICAVAVALASTVAFGVAARKTIALSINGDTQTVTTYAMSVTRLLEERGVDVKSHDLVQSTSGDILSNHDVVTVRSAYQTTISIDGQRVPFWTVATSASQLLGFFQQNENEAAKVTVDIDNIYSQLTGGLVINESGPVTVIADGKTSVAPNGKLPAASILDSKGISLNKEDRVSVEKDGDKTVLRVQRVTHGQETTTVAIPHGSQTIVDKSLKPGTSVVRQQGEDGEKKQVYNVTYVDGVAESETLKSETVTTMAIDQIIAVGAAKSDTDKGSDKKSDSADNGKADSGSNNQHESSGNNANNTGDKNNSSSGNNTNTDTNNNAGNTGGNNSGNTGNTGNSGNTGNTGGGTNNNSGSSGSDSGTTTTPSGRLWHATVAQAQAYAAGAAAQRGWTGNDWDCLVRLWTRESSWLWYAENASSGAYGIPQSLPADKMAAFGANYRDDAAVQIDWGLWYIAQAYGSPSKAWQHSEQVGWY